MSDYTALSHEYEESAHFARRVNELVLALKRGSRHTAVTEDIANAKRTLALLLADLGQRFSEKAGSEGDLVVPQEVLEELANRKGQQLQYFLGDLERAREALDSGKPIDSHVMSILDTLLDVADATTSVVFRRLRRR